MPSQSVLPKLSQSRVFKASAIETLNFLKDMVEDAITKRALVYTVDNSFSGRSFGSFPMIMDEEEFADLKKRKEEPEGYLFQYLRITFH